MRKVLRVVFDCNVYLQAIGSPNGPAGRCLQLALDREVTLFTSPKVLEELREVAARPRLAAKFRFTPERLENVITAIEIAATSVESFVESFAYDRDPDDAHYVNLALAAGAEFIVSRDRDLLDLGNSTVPLGRTFALQHPELSIVDPVEFLQRSCQNIVPMPSQRYKITLAYKGTRYHGWQAQPATEPFTGEGPVGGREVLTVQGCLTKSIEWVVGHPVNCVGSSRTDAGVHAKAQVPHFDTSKVQIPPESLRKAVNHQLPGDILIHAIEPVPADFDAIFWTTRKRYQYFIWNAPDRPAFFNELAWHRWQKLDGAAMAAAAGHWSASTTSPASPGRGMGGAIRYARSSPAMCIIARRS